MFYGKADKGATTAGWGWFYTIGAKDVGVFSGNITGLTASTLYYFRFEAKNGGGSHVRR